ncbi:hypothetical protein [Mesorhizobium sp. J428]|uniref:hypothetical protein n=1 Tax=Mesorhizobium sp. J428 TaxID=2898440 RepID=UPI002150B311|nr:hypothetical protein [Mesorhizobium sp. J428]MCR5857562.1 hypothetical protein [Mesorhizobium sp. J428]
MQVLKAICVAACAALAALTPAAAEAPGAVSTPAASTPSAPTLTAAQRAAITRELVAKWQSVVKASPGGSVERWSARLQAAIAEGDAANVLRATTAPTLELMHAALTGYIPTAAEVQAASGAIGNGLVAPQALGDPNADLTFTPLPNGRCRIANSVVLNSQLPAATPRNLIVSPAASYQFQGGVGTVAGGNSSLDCGIPNTFVAAYALSISLLSPAGNGTFRVYAYGQTHETGPAIMVNAGSYGEAGNLTVPACNSCSWDITVRASTQVHYVIDVIGYYTRPVATALDCVVTPTADVNLAAGGTANVVAPACPVGYTQTSTNCEASTWQMPVVYFRNGVCSAQNNETFAATLRASRTCCRVPGR